MAERAPFLPYLCIFSWDPEVHPYLPPSNCPPSPLPSLLYWQVKNQLGNKTLATEPPLTNMHEQQHTHKKKIPTLALLYKEMLIINADLLISPTIGQNLFFLTFSWIKVYTFNICSNRPVVWSVLHSKLYAVTDLTNHRQKYKPGWGTGYRVFGQH